MEPMRPAGVGKAADALRAAREALRAPTGDPLAQHGLGEGLRRRSARGAMSTVAGQSVRLILQTGATVVLARLIAPEEYGLVGMVIALIGIGDALMNMGLSQATVQRRNIDATHVTFFFWLQASVGVLLTALTMGLAGRIADFYGREQLVPLTMALATMFLINGFAAQHQAVLWRQMRFGTLALIDLIGLVSGVVLAIVIAILGGGAWALVAQTMAGPVCRLLLSWKASGWRPGPPRRARGVSGMVRFGLNITATNALDFSAQNIDNVLIGRFYGAEALGLYTRAYSLLLLPIRQVTEPIAQVAVPVLSFLQGEPERYRRFFTVALSSVAYVSLPLICLLSALSNEVIALMLGPQWAGAAAIFQILAFAGVIISLRSTNGWLFVSTGQTGRQAVWALVNRPVIVAGIIAGVPWGVTGIAWGFVGAHIALLVPSFIVSRKGTAVHLLDFWRSTWRPVVLGAAVYGLGTLVHTKLEAPDWLVVVVGGFSALLLMATAMRWWPAVRRDVSDLREAFGLAQRTRAGGQPQAVEDESRTEA
jgi:O-antigen/teichoic acid export membrane protein